MVVAVASELFKSGERAGLACRFVSVFSVCKVGVVGGDPHTLLCPSPKYKPLYHSKGRKKKEIVIFERRQLHLVER